MADVPSSNQSQTPQEQADLVQYEHNLAACYEAEYLLSLKMQEEFYGSRSHFPSTESDCGTAARSNYLYCDDFEVVWMPSTDQEYLQAFSSTTTSDNMPALSGTTNCGTTGASNYSGVTTGASNYSGVTTGPLPIISEHSNGSGLPLTEEMDCGMAEFSSALASANSTCQFNGAPECNSGDRESCSHNSHIHYEGPSRKKIRLHHEE